MGVVFKRNNYETRIRSALERIRDMVSELERHAQVPGPHRAACQDAAAELQWAAVTTEKALTSISKARTKSKADP